MEFTLVMVGVFFLLGLGLMITVNFLAAQAATTAAQRGLEIAQTPGQSEQEATSVMSHLSTASGVVSTSAAEITSGAQTVRVVVRVETVLGTTITRVAAGPRLRFVPQTRS
jgi:hypothetical protein